MRRRPQTEKTRAERDRARTDARGDRYRPPPLGDGYDDERRRWDTDVYTDHAAREEYEDAFEVEKRTIADQPAPKRR